MIKRVVVYKVVGEIQLKQIALRNLVVLRGTHANNRFHFTLVDIKSATFAKILIMLHLLDQTRATEAIACAIYVFDSLIMPSFAYKRLQRTIAVLIDKCQKGISLADWIYVADPQRQAISKHLLAWQGNLYGKYNTREFREHGMRHASRDRRQRNMKNGRDPAILPLCEHEDELFWTYGIFMPDGEALLGHEKKLAQLLKGTKRHPHASPNQEIQDIVDNTWKPNVTLGDVDWEAARDYGCSHPIGDWGFSGTAIIAYNLFNPQEAQKRMFGLRSFWGWFMAFFGEVSSSIEGLRSQMCVELVVGEMNEFLDRLQHDAWSTRGDKQGKFDPGQFPKIYNRIHMSNVPDYVGGALSTFLYGIPVLYPDQSSAIKLRVLLNTPTFGTHEQFLSEYTLLTDLNSVEQCFNVKLRNDSPSLTDWGQSTLVLHDYTMWTVGSSKPLRFDKLMTRHVSEKYFQAHLLKICLPYPRPEFVNGRDVRAPLNLTTLFRLLNHFHQIVYPAHWLSEILGNMLDGTISTTARAPRAMALTSSEARKIHPSISTCIKPWVAEPSTLTSIWQHLLPFGLLFDSNLVPSLDIVRHYSIKLPKPRKSSIVRSVISLVFWDASRESPPRNMRQTLLDEERSDRSKTAKSIREPGVLVLTTCKWVKETTTASFWLRGDVVEEMKQGNWKVYIWRLDTEEDERLTAGVPLRGNLQEGSTWTGDGTKLPIKPLPKEDISTKAANTKHSAPKTTTTSENPEPEAQTPSASFMPAHISNDVDRKLIKEYQITLSRLAEAAAEDAKEPGLPKSIKKTRQAYIRAIDELRRRVDPSFIPSKATKFEDWPYIDLIHEVREVEMMVIMAPLPPNDLDCQMHIAKLVAGRVPSLATPSKESLQFVEKFDEHIERRRRYDAFKEKQAKEPRPERQMNPDCAAQ